jgi:hypothetical protein
MRRHIKQKADLELTVGTVVVLVILVTFLTSILK